MSFLAPLFLLGAAAIALPVIFHLIRRSSREKVRFSSLMFLMPSPPRITRRSRLEHLLLLLLRCGVICLLSLAFARPFLPREMFDPPVDVESTKKIVLVDTSASMRREGVWPAAVAKAESIVRGSTPGDQLAVFAFDQQVVSVIGFEEWNRTRLAERAPLLRERLSSLKPTWAAGHLDTALIRAAEEFQAADQQHEPAQLIVISDLQEGSRLERLQAFEWPKGVVVRLEGIKPKRAGNGGLHLVAERDGPGSAASSLRLRVTNAGDSTVEQFQIAWTADGPSHLGAAALLPPPSRDAGIKAYVPAGQSRVFQAPPPPTNWEARALLLTGDQADFDNRVFWAQPLPMEVNVLFLGSDSETDPRKPLYYLRRAFQQSARQKINLLTGDAATRQLTGTNDARLAILTTDVNPALRGQLAAWLRSGGTVLMVLNGPAMVKMLEEITGLRPIPCEEASSGSYAMLEQIAFEHPLFAPFADPRYSDFTKIHFWKHRRLSAETMPDRRVLARFDDGSPALIEAPLDRGRLLVLTVGWDPGESQLALSSKFVPLLYSLLEYSGVERPGSGQFLVAEAAPITVGERGSVLVRTPDGRSVEVRGTGRFAATEVPGIYTVVSGQATQQFAVNVPPAESRTAPLPPEELERLGVPLGNTFQPDPRRVEQQRRQLHTLELENRQKLWRWLIVGVLAVLVVETLFAARLSRREFLQEVRV